MQHDCIRVTGEDGGKERAVEGAEGKACSSVVSREGNV